MSITTDIESLRTRATEIARHANDLRRPSGQTSGSESSDGSPPSLRLAHYTSLEALISMLQASGGGLRLSDSSTMNDPEEGRATRDGRGISRLLADEFGQESWPWKRYGSANVCCFVGVDRKEEKNINAGDDLLFWRLYGSECRGISIAVAPHKSRELVEASVIQRVTYTDEPRMQVDIAAISSLLQDLDGLRKEACAVGAWTEIYELAIPECDLLMGQRFLWKRSHFEVEAEYRALAFITEEEEEEEACEDSGFSCRGLHVQYGRLRTYVQTSQLTCASILTTDSDIIIGNNVPKAEEVANTVKRLVEGLGRAPNVVRTRVSSIRYRPR